MIASLSYITAFIGAAATVYFLIVMTENVGPLLPAAVIMLFVTGPYVALGLLAWSTRTQRVISCILFAFVIALTCFSVFAYAAEYENFLNRGKTTPGGSNWMPFLLAAAQWFATFLLAGTFLPRFLLQKRNQRLPNG